MLEDPKDWLKVDCRLTDCAYFRRQPDNPVGAFCAHPDKPHYMKNLSCPLYKKVWDSMKEAELRARFKLNRRKFADPPQG